MPATKLNKWGNSQGVLIPKALCESAGFRVGDRVELVLNPDTRKIELSCSEPTAYGPNVRTGTTSTPSSRG